MEQSSHKIGPLRAIYSAFVNKDISFYPRSNGQAGEDVYYDSGSMMREIGEALRELRAADADMLKSALGRTRESLNEVKSQTEYQDQKATRLVTIVAFLSALSGALFTRFVDQFPFQLSVTWLPPWELRKA